MTRGLAMAALGLALGCGEATDEVALSDDQVFCDEAYDQELARVTWETFGRGFLLERCQSCHSSTTADREGAPENIVFDTEEDVWRAAPLILQVSTGDEPLMPPRGGVGDDDRYKLEVWLRCGG